MSQKTTPTAKVRQPAKQRRFALALLAGAISATAHPALAQQIPASVRADERVSFRIAAQPLSSALSDYARQAGVNALYFSEGLHGLNAPALEGDFTRQEALDRLLRGSGYSGRIDGANLVLVQDVSRPQRESAAASGADTAEGDDADAADEEEIVVTGTRIRGAAPVGANLVTLDREAIEESGRSTVQDVLGLVPQNFTGGTFETTQQGGPEHNANRSFSSSINLRGLGPGSTLSLVNGRRLAPAGLGHFVDISTIPLAAIERVEVLADGASAAYGSDAVGGVVNVILRDDFEGAETSLRFGSDGRGDVSEQVFSHVAGWSSDRFSFVAAYEYRERTGLDWNDRDFASDSNLTRFGGLDYSRPQANPGTIIRIGVTPVTLAIPRGQDGTSLDASELIPGQVNRQNAVEGQSLLPEQISHGLFLSGRFEITPRLEIFADVLAGQRDAEAYRTQSFASIRVPETNYYRQLNTLFPGQGPLTIAYWFGDDLGPILSQSESRAITASYGLQYDLGSHWRVELVGGHAASDEFIRLANAYDPSSPAVAAALASSNAATAFNPFADGSNTPQSVLAGFTSTTDTQSDADVSTFALKADGPLLQLWGGPLRAALGYEQRHERFVLDRVDYRFAGVTRSEFQPPQSRRIDAYFVELNAPLIGPDNNVPLVDALTLSLSARREEASDYGDATVPRIGLTWDMTPELRLRAAWGESFRGPTFDQLDPSGINSFAVVTTALDPLADDGTTGVMLSSGGGDDLRPESAETWSAGFDFRPAWLNGFSISATWGDHAPADAALAAPDEAAPASYGPARPSPLESEADAARTSSILFSNRGGGAAPASVQSFNETGRRAAFLNGQHGRDEGVLDASYVPPRSPYTIQAGATISAALITALNSDQPGRVIAQVSENVFDSVTGETLLIPQGARLIGSYDSDTAYGERRLLVVWNRLIMPNGWSIPLRAMPGADAAGSAGLTGIVDAHIGRIAVASLISAVLGVAANESEDEDDARLSQSIGDAAAQQAAQTGSRLVDRELNVRPTLRIRAGARVRVLVSQDIHLRPYPP